MRRFAPATTLLAMALSISLTGCVQDNIPSEEPASQATAASRAVQWPALRSLDELAHRTGNVIQNGDEASVRGFATQMRELALRVAADPIPAGARNAGEVRVLQTDLQSLADSMADAESLDRDSLAQSLQAFGPLVHRLMSSTGLPHEHAAAHDHDDPDHDDQDHDHSPTDSGPKTLKDLHEIDGPGPNGGTILHSSHTTHLELVVDPAAATIRLVVLDEDEQPLQLDDPLSAEMIFEGWNHSGNRLNIALYPDSSQLTYGHFEAFDEGLRGTEWIAGRLKGKFRESSVMATLELETGWPPTHPDAGHGLKAHDHAHGHEH